MRKFVPVLILALIFGGLYYLRQRGNEIVTPDRPARDSPAEPGIAAPGADVTGVVLKPPKAGEITIRVVDECDRPLAGMRVSVDGCSVRPRHTDIDGRATLQGLPATELVFKVSESRWPQKKYDYGQTDPTVPTGQEITVRLKGLSPIHGVVIGDNARPIPHLVVAALVPGGRAQYNIAFTDGEGRYTLWVPEGAKVDVSVSGKRGTYSERELDPLPIDGLVLGVTAPAKGVVVRPRTIRTDLTLSVRVLLPDGTPVAGAGVRPQSRTSGWIAQDTDAGGWARFEGLRSVGHEIHLFNRDVDLPPGAVNPKPPVVVPANQVVVLKMLKGVAVEGVFLDAGGIPLEMGQIEIGVGEWAMSRAAVNEQGRFRLAALPGRKLVITAISMKGGVKREGVIADGSELEIRLGE